MPLSRELILKLALEKARELGLERVLLTCDVENLGSRGVIEANGGELEGEFQLEFYDKPIRRYWINLELERDGRQHVYLPQGVAERGDDYEVVRVREMIRES